MSSNHTRLQSLFQNFYGVGLQEGKNKAVTDKFNIDGPLYSPQDDFKREVKKDTLPQLKKCLNDRDKGFLIICISFKIIFLSFCLPSQKSDSWM